MKEINKTRCPHCESDVNMENLTKHVQECQKNSFSVEGEVLD